MVVCNHTSQEWLFSDDYRTCFSIYFFWHHSDWDCVCFDIYGDMEGVQVKGSGQACCSTGHSRKHFSSFPFIFPVSSSARYINLLFSLYHASITSGVQSLSEAGNKPFLDFSWTIRWPANISSLCVVLMLISSGLLSKLLCPYQRSPERWSAWGSIVLLTNFSVVFLIPLLIV